eukprot:gene18791-20682_t
MTEVIPVERILGETNPNNTNDNAINSEQRATRQNEDLENYKMAKLSWSCCRAGTWFVLDGLGITCAFITYGLIVYAEFVVIGVILLADFPQSPWAYVHSVLFTMLAILAISAHARSMTSDPGSIPKGNFTEDNIRNYGYSTGDVVIRCTKCECIKMHRAHHCSTCDRCIRINNCVGEYNQKFFMLFTFYIMLISVYALILAISYIFSCSDKDWKGCSYFSPPATIVFLIFLVFEGLLFGIFTFIMLCTQVNAVVSDETAIENLKREQREKDGTWQTRLQNVFGGKLSVHWFSPFSAVPIYRRRSEFVYNDVRNTAKDKEKYKTHHKINRNSKTERAGNDHHIGTKSFFDFGGNEFKRTCIQQSSMEIHSNNGNENEIVEECQLEELCLDANELLDSPINKNIEDFKRRQTLRSYANKIPQQYSPAELNSFGKLTNVFVPIDNCKPPLPELVWASPGEVWEAMHLREKQHKRDPNYLSKHPSLQVRMRSILLDWLIEVCEVYRLHRETYHLAVDFVDRYLATQNNIAKQRLQLIGVTSLFIASKIEEIYPPKLTEFAYVTDGACTCEEITKQELLILQALSWKLSPVTPNSWLTMYLQINQHENNNGRTRRSKESSNQFEFPNLYQPLKLSRFSQLVDLSLLDVGSLKFTYSVLVSACIYHLLPEANITELTGHTWNELNNCVKWLTPFAQICKQQKLNSVKQFEKVSPEDAHNIQVHRCGLSLLDQVHEKVNKSREDNILRTSPIQCSGILTPPSSTKKEY